MNISVMLLLKSWKIVLQWFNSTENYVESNCNFNRVVFQPHFIEHEPYNEKDDNEYGEDI